MHLLIVAATFAEVEPLIQKFCPGVKPGVGFYSFRHRNNTVDVVITGAGMIATAYHLTKTLTKKKYDLAINAGIAGAFVKDMKIGEVVNVTRDLFGDMGAEDGNKFLSLIDLKLVKKQEKPFQSGQLFATGRYPGLRNVKAITVNKVHGKKSSINAIVKKYNPGIESMEGAAFFYCCLMETIPCIQIRSVSNYVERRNRDAWNIPLAVGNLNTELLNLLKQI